MMDIVSKGAALCLVSAVLVAVLKRKAPELALMVSLATVLLVSTVLVQAFDSVLSLIKNIIDVGNLPERLFQPLLRTVGIAIISRIASDLCKDAGENAIATVMESVGAVAAVVVALPLFEAVWEMLRSML